MKTGLWAVAFLLFLRPAHGQFTYQHSLPRVDSVGWYAISLVPDMLAHLPADFSDLRIRLSDRDSTDIPYLIKVDDDAPATDYVTLRPVNISRKNGVLFFTVKLARDQPVNRAFLSFDEENWDARVTVEGSHDEKDWFQLTRDKRILSISEQAISYRSTQVEWPWSRFDYLRFAIAADKPLTLKEVSFVWQEKNRGHYTNFTAPIALKTNQKQSVAKINLGAPSLVSKFAIAAPPGQKFYRTYRLERVTDSSQTEQGWIYYTEPLHTGVMTSYQTDTVHLAPTLCHMLQLTVYNDDNPPLAVRSVTFWSPRVRAIAYLPPGDYRIMYGNRSLRAPQYDVSHFERELPADIPVLQAGPAEELKKEQQQAARPWFQNPRWLWGILLAVATLLGYFTVRLLRKA
ncbi:MAG: DUF3999 family protein [Cyclobacteriaceae bacterium]|jgi:hypothetical protein|nr:DUF3999 family protein [Cyclobacteriaceae bacterium]